MTSATGPTLLPTSVASIVSLLSKSTSVSIRLGTLVGATLLDTARTGTLASLEISRAAVEGIVRRGSHGVVVRSGREAAELEGWASKGMTAFNTSISLTQLIISTAFELGQTTLSSISGIAETYVLTLDSIFGSTETSRAINEIVKLVREEFKDSSEHDGEVGIGDIVAGLTCFAILQYRTRAHLEEEESGRLMWDVVVDAAEIAKATASVEREDNDSKAGGPGAADTAPGDNLLPSVLFDKFPPNAVISVSTTSTTTSTTTIDVVGTSPPDFTPPPGAVVLSESSHHDGRQRYTIVYETVTRSEQSKRLKRENGGEVEVAGDDEQIVGEEPRVFEIEEPRKGRQAATHTRKVESSEKHERRRRRDLRARDSHRSGSDTERPPPVPKKTRIASPPEGRSALPRPAAAANQPKKRAITNSSLSDKNKEKDPGSERAKDTAKDTKSSLRRALSPSITAMSLTSYDGDLHPTKNNYVPSIYTLHTSHSTTSLLHLLSYTPPTSEDPGPCYPTAFHLLHNLRKYIRFSAASYGARFMRFLLGSQFLPLPTAEREHHLEHLAFSFHTSLPVDTILLSSHYDPSGGFDSAGHTGTGRPLVHFVCVDHEAAAVVVTCRGTLGLEDALIDLTCEYTSITLRGHSYRVHKGMYNSATLLLRSRLLHNLATALAAYPSYGLVLTGHSLGGGVAALVSILISAPHQNGAFTTSHPALPQDRPIHCYAFGSPAIVCESLRKATRGLVTTVVNGNDVVPSLSIGVVRDFHSVALSFREDTDGVLGEVRRRFLRGVFCVAVLKTLRAGMRAEKLVPPGEVWRVRRAYSITEASYGGIFVITPTTELFTAKHRYIE
ncbi:alpha/beta-hydrolase [Wilcoxina mikolae CBS 423.85]|nr:alpha/beta-hydrolase [Wilcoxina mikolae CBS 423.85]